MAHHIVHVVRLHLSREDASASALFVSPEREDMSDIIERAAAMGITAEVDIDSAPYVEKSAIAEWLAQFNREQTPEPAITRPEIEQRVDELTRAQRNTDRQLGVIAGMLKELLEGKSGVVPAVIVSQARPDLVAAGEQPMVDGRRIGVPPDSVPPAQVEIGYSDEQIDQHVDRLGRGRPIERGESSQADANRTLTQQITGAPGVLTGNMALTGGSASSEVWGVGSDGAATKTALPKVGDSLKPPHLRNGNS